MIINPIVPIWIISIICIAIILMNIKNKNRFSMIRQILISIFIFIVNLRFMIPSGNGNKINNNLDVLLVIDNTISMIAEDYNGTNPRLSAVKEDCDYIINKLSGSKFSIITFSNEAQINIPYTKDINAASEVINTMQVIDNMYSKGSSLNVSFEDMKKSLESSNKNKNRKRIVFFISDGEITNEDKLRNFSELKEYVDDGAVLGYGTNNGGYMKDNSSYNTNNSNYLMDKTTFPYKKAISKIDEENLKKIAQDLGIEYINMNKVSNVDNVLNRIIKNTQNLDIIKDESSYTDIYYIFVIPICILLFIEFVYYKRRIFK